MIRTSIFRSIRPLYKTSLRRKSEPILNIEKLEEEVVTGLDVVDEEANEREKEIERKRNKSRLRYNHRNMVHDQNPFPESKLWFHDTLSYNRKMYGRYGAQSGVDPVFCWPTKQELDNKKEYEKVAYPYTLIDAIQEAKLKRVEKDEEIKARQEDIATKIKKLDQWKQDLKNKILKKEDEALVAKQRKERLIEEVRAHFGYTVDPRDDKFKELLEKKEKEQRKASKEARKKEKEARMISALLNKKTEEGSQKPTKDGANKPKVESS